LPRFTIGPALLIGHVDLRGQYNPKSQKRKREVGDEVIPGG